MSKKFEAILRASDSAQEPSHVKGRNSVSGASFPVHGANFPVHGATFPVHGATFPVTRTR